MASTETPDNEPHGQDRSEQEAAESAATSPDAIERRLKRNILISIAIFIILAALFGTLRFTAGVCIGGALAYLNYRWLHGSLKTILTAAAVDQAPPNAVWTIGKFLLRWIVII